MYHLVRYYGSMANTSKNDVGMKNAVQQFVLVRGTASRLTMSILYLEESINLFNQFQCNVEWPPRNTKSQEC